MKPKISFKKHSELPLEKDGANLFLKVMTTVSVFVFVLVFAVYLVLNGVVQNWTVGMSNTLTVQLEPSERALSASEQAQRRQVVVDFFENLDAVERVGFVSEKQMQKLMSPWLGADADISSLPLPELLDVKLKSDQNLDMEKTAAALSEKAPYASLDNHRLWLGRLVKFANVLRLLSFLMLCMVFSVCILSISYAVCTSLAIHRPIIEILHIMGAKDSYMASQYAHQNFILGFCAGLAGMLLGVLAIKSIGSVAAHLNATLLGGLSIGWKGWLLMLTLPLWSALLSMTTAWISVKRTLRKMV